MFHRSLPLCFPPGRPGNGRSTGSASPTSSGSSRRMMAASGSRTSPTVRWGGDEVPYELSDAGRMTTGPRPVAANGTRLRASASSIRAATAERRRVERDDALVPAVVRRIADDEGIAILVHHLMRGGQSLL